MLKEILPYLYGYGWLMATSLLLLSFYHLFLSRKHSYRFMRRYLLAIPLVCLVQLCTMATHHYYTADQAPLIMQMNQEEADAYLAKYPERHIMVQEMPTAAAPAQTAIATPANEPEQATALSSSRTIHVYIEWALLGICGVSVILILGMISSLLLMYRKMRRMPSTISDDGYRIIRSSHINTPFSFWRTIFLPLNRTSEAEKVFIRHEKAHITCAHYIDVLCIEVMVRLLWFNPLLWYVRKALRDLHEYEADRLVLSAGEDLHTYQTLLLGEIGESSSIVANGFAKSLIRRRFLEMKQQSSAPVGRWRKAMATTWLLLLCGVFVLYAFPNEQPIVLQIQQAEPFVHGIDSTMVAADLDTCTSKGLTDTINIEKDTTATKGKVDSLKVKAESDSTATEQSQSIAEVRVVAYKQDDTAERPTHAEDGWPILYDLPSPDASDNKSMQITHTETETHLTFIRPIKSDDQLLRFGGPDSYIVDFATGAHYKARRSIPAQAWHYFHLQGKQGTNCKVTVVFPRLPETTQHIQLYQVTHHLQSGDIYTVSQWQNP